MALDGPRGKMTFSGTLDGPRMVEFVQHHLGPNLHPGDIVVLDGVSIHKMKSVRAAIESFGATALILPPYSPELNPIEHLWSTLKARLRAVGTSTFDELVRLMSETWDKLDSSYFPRWVESCGYAAAST